VKTKEEFRDDALNDLLVLGSSDDQFAREEYLLDRLACAYMQGFIDAQDEQIKRNNRLLGIK
jgi:hypothetical protein